MRDAGQKSLPLNWGSALAQSSPTWTDFWRRQDTALYGCETISLLRKFNKQENTKVGSVWKRKKLWAEMAPKGTEDAHFAEKNSPGLEGLFAR